MMSTMLNQLHTLDLNGTISLFQDLIFSFSIYCVFDTI